MRRTYNKAQRKERGADTALLMNEDFKKAEVVIGIDPGVKTGFAEWNRTNRVLTLHTLTFWELIDILSILRDLKVVKVFVIIEDPNLNPAMHWNQHSTKGSMNYGAKIAQNVGANKKEAELLIKYMEINSIPFYRYKPTTSKWKPEEFRRITRYAGKCSQHAIDAAGMVWNI